MEADVECYSGSMYAEKPLAFLHDGKKHRVSEVLAEYLLENGKCFFVRTEDDLLFQLFYNVTRDRWEVSDL